MLFATRLLREPWTQARENKCYLQEGKSFLTLTQAFKIFGLLFPKKRILGGDK